MKLLFKNTFLLMILLISITGCKNEDAKNNKKKKDVITAPTENAINVKKESMLTISASLVMSARDEKTESEMYDSPKSCFIVKDLNSELSRNYSGVIELNSEGKWIIYLTDGTYKINGVTFPAKISDIEVDGKLNKTSC